MAGPVQWKTDAQDTSTEAYIEALSEAHRGRRVEGSGGLSANSGKEMWVGACLHHPWRPASCATLFLLSEMIGSSFEAFAGFLMGRALCRRVLRDLGDLAEGSVSIPTAWRASAG